ncbi:MAG: antirepressor regulating drug resistance protein, partial [Parvularculaceae bacterium]|nr:antirepressor regulating drug resistance protein [Parvularculaceae bacterium]
MIAGDFVEWFAETTLAVAALVLVVLVVRKPIAQAFGPEAAYLLWLAPALRLLTPELSLLPPVPAPITADGAAAAILFDAAPGGAAGDGADYAV